MATCSTAILNAGWVNGTNPRSATADFTLRIAPYYSSGSIAVLMWPAEGEVSYTVQFKDDLVEEEWFDLPDTFITIANRAYYPVPADQPSRFYRVVERNWANRCDSRIIHSIEVDTGGDRVFITQR